MGQYLSLRLDFPDGHSPAKIIEPLFSSDFYEPVAIGGIAPREKHGADWFIAGYALEDFISWESSRRYRHKQNVTIAAENGTREHDYLMTITSEIRQGARVAHELSPFEIEDETIGVTFLPSVRLDASVLEEMEQWIGTRHWCWFYVYGTVALAIGSQELNEGEHKDQLPWNKAFRYYDPDEGRSEDMPRPFLEARLTKYPPPRYQALPGGSMLTLHSRSRVWLQKAPALGVLSGLVGEQEADENVLNLGLLARTLVPSGGTKPHSELDLEGSIFWTERSRIEIAFSDILS